MRYSFAFLFAAMAALVHAYVRLLPQLTDCAALYSKG